MPIFEYFCPECDHEFEEIILGAELPSCPKCQAKDCQKLVSRPGVRRSIRNFTGSLKQAKTVAPSKCGGCSGGNCSTC